VEEFYLDTRLWRTITFVLHCEHICGSSFVWSNAIPHVRLLGQQFFQLYVSFLQPGYRFISW